MSAAAYTIPKGEMLMAYPKTKLVEEDNTIYEIDLECMRRKQEMQERQKRRYGKNQKSSSSGENAKKKPFR